MSSYDELSRHLPSTMGNAATAGANVAQDAADKQAQMRQHQAAPGPPPAAAPVPAAMPAGQPPEQPPAERAPL